jgi:hypothetical protein
MHIEQLNITNFLGIAHLAIKPQARTLLLAGPNGSNKSSVLDAIRFALTGHPPRGIRTKSAYRDMLRDGAAEGSVAITVDGKAGTRSARTGELSAGGLGGLPEALPYVLEAQRFAALDVTARRAFLFGLVGLQTDHESIARDLIERDVPQGYVDAIKPLLRAGFEAGAKQAETKATEARGAWKQITGETYGSVKGASWAPKDIPPAPSAREVTDAEAEARTAAAKVASLDQRIGAA